MVNDFEMRLKIDTVMPHTGWFNPNNNNNDNKLLFIYKIYLIYSYVYLLKSECP